MITSVVTQEQGKQQPSSVILIVNCDLPGCNNTAQFLHTEKDKAVAENPWLQTYRTVNTGDNRAFGYCGDICEIKGIESGKHGIPEPPKILTATNPSAIAAAAQQAARAKSSEQALREGKPANIEIASR